MIGKWTASHILEIPGYCQATCGVVQSATEHSCPSKVKGMALPSEGELNGKGLFNPAEPGSDTAV